MERLLASLRGLFFPGSERSFEQDLCQGMSLLAGLLALLVVLPANLAQGISWTVNVPLVAFAAGMFALHAQARKGHRQPLAIVLMFQLLLDLIWFGNGGSQGSIPMFFFLGVLAAVVLFYGRTRLVMLGLTLVNGLALYVLEWHVPSLVTPFPSENARMFDLTVGFVVCVLVSALTVWLVVAAYHRERAALAQATEERRRLEAMVMRNQKLDSLGSLAGGVAHDMNNVLAAVLGLAELHQERLPEGDPTRRALDTIARACLRGRTLVQGLLDFARQGLSEARLLDLAGLAEEQVALLERTALQGLTLERDFQADLGPVKGDPSALGHALMNLLVNAAQAMPKGGTLTLRTRSRDDGGTELQVQDTGCGMTPEVLARAMDPFFTTKPQGEGTGLGLAIVYATLKAHRAEVHLESAPAQGTTVTLRFPAALPQSEAAPAPTPVPALPKGRRVLIVDDDPLVQTSLGGMLERLDLEVLRAPSGEAALAQLHPGDLPDAVILDLNMPGMGGAACLEALRRRWPTLRILISTGRMDETARGLLAAHPEVGALPKPYTRLELQAKLQALWTQNVPPKDP